MKRLLIPPLLPVLVIVALCVWVLIDETRTAPRVLDGRIDNAPLRAAGIIIFFSPLLYIPFAILNMVDSAFDRFSNRITWLATLGLGVSLCIGLITVFHRPEVDSSASDGAGFAVLMVFLILLPMSLLRRLVLSPRREVSTMIPGSAAPFESLFPNAGSAPLMTKSQSAEKSHREIRIGKSLSKVQRPDNMPDRPNRPGHAADDVSEG